MRDELNEAPFERPRAIWRLHKPFRPSSANPTLRNGLLPIPSFLATPGLQ